MALLTFDVGYDTPYLTDIYGRQIGSLIFFVVIGIPTLYVSIRLLKKVKWINNKLTEIWAGIFWNTPLRTFTELYIEMSLILFLNTLNVSD